MKFVDWVVKHPIINLILGFFTYGFWWIIWIICVCMKDFGRKKEFENNKTEKLNQLNNKIISTEQTISSKPTKRYSNVSFEFLDENNYLKYKYYDVQIKGTEHQDFDIRNIEIDTDLFFEFEPDNPYDENAIKVLYKNICIGYVPKNNIQNMIKNYTLQKNKHVKAFVSAVEENTKHIEMAIAFYQELTEDEFQNIQHIDTTLIKTTKKDEFDIFSRQDNLASISEGEEVEFDYMYDSNTYLVCDTCANELGEISIKISEKLQEFEDDGKKLYGIVLETFYNSADNIQCKIRIFII